MADRWHDRPWRLLPNRVSRFYRGGLLLDAFRDVPYPTDTDEPEDWVGSATRSWTRPAAPPTLEGLGMAEIDGERRRVADVLAADPMAVTGVELADTPGGPTTGILVKLLDAGTRLPVHLHPSRAFAREHLESPFGKAEAWIVLATRELPGEDPPHIRLGFRRDVGHGELRRWIETEDGAAIRDALHGRATQAGDMWFVPPGTPHAIGAGVFILEVQEPTDFSIVLETAGFPVDLDDAHLRLGWDTTLDAVDLRETSAAELDRLHAADGGDLPPDAAPFFAARRLVAEGALAPALPARFVIGVVTSGVGEVRTAAGRLGIRRGDTFGVPAAAAATLELVGEGPLEVILCHSGRPDAPAGR